MHEDNATTTEVIIMIRPEIAMRSAMIDCILFILLLVLIMFVCLLILSMMECISIVLTWRR